MILLSIIVAALGVISLVCVLLVMWPAPPGGMDELEARRRLRPDGRDVERFECADPEGDWIADQEKGA